MAPHVHLMNIDVDDSLASGRQSYTPSRHVAELQRALALMPALWAATGDYIIAAPEQEAPLKSIRPDVFVYHGEPGVIPSPWGWSASAAGCFLSAGVSNDLIPVSKALERHRMLSHRRTAVELARRLAEVFEVNSPNEPQEITDARFLPSSLEGLVIKHPWSSSGRGVAFTRRLSPQKARELASAVIRKQGSVIIERELTRVMDMAFLYDYDGFEVHFRGISVFTTDSGGRYASNLVGPQPVLIERTGLSADHLTRLAAQTGCCLNDILGRDGIPTPLGVDMLICKPEGGEGTILAPVIEVNMRRTMGRVAFDMAQLSPGAYGSSFNPLEWARSLL